MKTSRATLELGKPTMREISEKLWPTICVHNVYIRIRERGREGPAGWIAKQQALSGLFGKQKNKAQI
jgi:hypothetical protein